MFNVELMIVCVNVESEDDSKGPIFVSFGNFVHMTRLLDVRQICYSTVKLALDLGLLLAF